MTEATEMQPFDAEVARDLAEELADKAGSVGRALRAGNHPHLAPPFEALGAALAGKGAPDPLALPDHLGPVADAVAHATSPEGIGSLPPATRAAMADVGLSLDDLVACYPALRPRILRP